MMLRLGRIRSGVHLAQSTSQQCRASSSAIQHSQVMQANQDYRQREAKHFSESFHRILRQLTDNQLSRQSEELFKANQWLRQVIEYNVPHGKQYRGLLAVLTYDVIANTRIKTEEHMEKIRAIGWAVELFQSYFLMLDDIMDNSITRRGQPCWHRKDKVGLMACNDATMVESGMYYLIKLHYKNHPYYVQLVELFNEIFRYTAYGQCMDMMSNPTGGVPDLSVYTLERYNMIIRYKTAYYTIVFPVRVGMYAAGIGSDRDHQKVEKILLRIGELFQNQDDFLDYFCDSAVTGKIGTDIEDGKCCWNIVNALIHCTEEQKQILQQNYGRPDRECVSRVTQVYEEIGLRHVFETHEATEYEAILEMIDALCEGSNIPKNLFDEPLKIVTKRRR